MHSSSRLFKMLAPVLALASIFTFSPSAQAVDLLQEGFDLITDLPSKGWSLRNLSDPLGSTDWFQGDTVQFDAEAGPLDSYLAANFNNTGSVGTISNWAITPTRTYSDGDTFTFYTRTQIESNFADRLEIRLSTNGASSDVGNTATSVGDFTTLLIEINPTLISDGYPQIWTQYTATLTGLGVPTQGRIAFRYFVTDAGESGTNGNFIGIDTLVITNAVPEPSTYALAALSIATIATCARKRRSQI